MASQAATIKHTRKLFLARKQADAELDRLASQATTKHARKLSLAREQADAKLEKTVAVEEWAHAFAHAVTNYLLSEAKKLGIEGGSIALICYIIENLMGKLQVLVDLEPCATPLVSATDDFTEFVERQFVECCLADTDEATPWDFTDQRATAVKASGLIRRLEVVLLNVVKNLSVSEMSVSEPVSASPRLSWEQKGKAAE